MFNLSDDQVLKLHEALATGDATAVLACLMLLFPTKRSGEFISSLVKVAKQDPDHAEQLLRMAVTLYEKHFPEEHTGGLSALCSLTQLLDAQGQEDDITETFINATYPLVLRAARAIGKVEEGDERNNGKKLALHILRDCNESHD